MSNIAGGDGPKYWAFISYSHKDAAFGRRLHRRLESYAVPRRLAGRVTAQGAVPRRLTPIFRDREEFSAANDLSTEVRAALQVSRSLIVVCSPAAAASPWVAREVETFRALHPDRPVLAAIREGEPPACFPDALRGADTTGVTLEPLAADFRKGRDGADLGLLKLIAGILGLGLDELVQRDAQRRTQRVTAVTAAALVGMLAMGLLTIFALNARAEADRQRNEAEGLVEFMLTDLRDRLKGVGRLDIMAAVNERSLHYYADQNLNTLPPESLERRARILHAMGEDDETRRDHAAALTKFQEAMRSTSALLAAAPRDPERIFDQAQSEFWIGDVDYERGRPKDARRAFDEYKRLVDELITIAPNDPIDRREAAYADGALCALDLDVPPDPPASLRDCGAALAQMEQAERLHGTKEFEVAIINRHAWMADAYRANGEGQRARAERLLEEQLLDAEIANDPNNMHLQEMWVAIERAQALLDLDAGQKVAAQQKFARALDELDAMTKFEPANKAWAQLKTQVRLEENRSN